jgi:hypothetical protein
VKLIKSDLRIWIRSFLTIGFLWFSIAVEAQEKSLNGKITNTKDVEGIHILNQSSRFNTVSNSQGEFRIRAKLMDTLLISSIAYVPEQLIITQEIYSMGFISITLKDLVNELDEVQLGPRLSGNLELDIKNIKIIDTLNFDDVGIPGFKGKPEEKIVPIVPGIGLITSVDVEALYKHISGYYRKLRLQRKWESENVVVSRMIHFYTPKFFHEAYEIPEERLYDFLLFCMETTDIKHHFEAENYSLVLTNFKEQSKGYILRLNEE